MRLDARTASGSDADGRTRSPTTRSTRSPACNAADCLAESVADVAAIVMPEHLRSTGAGADQRAFIDVAVEPVASGDASCASTRVYGTTLLNAEDGVDWTARPRRARPVSPAR